MTPWSRTISGTSPRFAPPRPAVAGLVAGLLAFGSCLAAPGAGAPAPGPGALAAPPGVIVDDNAAEPLAPDPESLYIKLLAAKDESRERGGDLTLEPSPEPATATRDRAGEGDRKPVGRAVAVPGGRNGAAGDTDASRDAAAIADKERGAGPVRNSNKSAADDAKESDGKDRNAKDGGAKKGPCSDQAEECREALKRLRDDAISDVALDIRIGGRPGSDYPCECRLEGETFQPRRFATTMMTWKAAGYCHKPLYFEDWSLERYGHSHGPLADPFFSAAHFFVTLPVLPYKMGVELPWECVYPLGYYRPGNCAPWTIPAVPISCRGFAVQAATVTGIVFALP